MNQYLVMYRPPNDNKYYPSLHIWPEILTMLRKKDEVGGFIKVFDLRTGNPQQLLVVKSKGNYWLEDLYENHVEG